jgi:hypothetical protein
MIEKIAKIPKIPKAFKRSTTMVEFSPKVQFEEEENPDSSRKLLPG